MNDPFKTHGAFSWCKLMIPDPEAVKCFYGTLFGWTLEDHGYGPGEPIPSSRRAAGMGGIMKRSPECTPDAPPHWGTYVTVEHVDPTARKAEPLGANTLVPPTDTPRSDAFACSKTPKTP